MGRKKIVAEKKQPKEIRDEVRHYIKYERDTMLKRWMSLGEAVRSEDYRRDNFYRRKQRENARCLPINIQKVMDTRTHTKIMVETQTHTHTFGTFTRKYTTND